MTDPYAAQLADLFQEFDLPGDPTEPEALTRELQRHGLRVVQGHRADLPERMNQSAELLDANGIRQAYTVGEHVRIATINALRRYLQGRHEREI